MTLNIVVNKHLSLIARLTISRHCTWHNTCEIQTIIRRLIWLHQMLVLPRLDSFIARREKSRCMLGKENSVLWSQNFLSSLR